MPVPQVYAFCVMPDKLHALCWRQRLANRRNETVSVNVTTRAKFKLGPNQHFSQGRRALQGVYKKQVKLRSCVSSITDVLSETRRSTGYGEPSMQVVTHDDAVSILGYFDGLDDPRSSVNRQHLLGDLIVISVCGVLVGADGPKAIDVWARVHAVR